MSERRRAEAEARRSQKQLRALSARALAVREEERTRISREVHDQLGQDLTALRMGLGWVRGQLDARSAPIAAIAVRDKIDAMANLAADTIQTIRRIAAELRPPVLDHLGIGAALEWQAQQFQSQSGIRCEVSAEMDGLVLSRDASTALFRVFQEALTNVARHATATRVDVTLRRVRARAVLEIADNGMGIRRKQLTDPRSLGIVGMRERARQLGGDVVIRLARPTGTAVIVKIPLHERRRRRA